MELVRELGNYSPGIMRLFGGFQLNSTGAPTVFRDATNVASAKKRFSVVRTSIGLYTVTLKVTGVLDNYPVPKLPFIDAWIEQAAAPTANCSAHYVKNTWSTSTRSFQIAINLTATGAASDGDAADRVSFEFAGSIISTGTDPA